MEEPDVVPFVPYYADCVSLDDSDPVQRERGIKNDTYLLENGFIDELRLYGDRISQGMISEILLAWEHGIAINPITEKTKKEYLEMFENLHQPYHS